MNFGKILKAVVVTAGPAVATYVGGPVAGGLVVTAMGSAGLTKVAGKKIEAATGRPVHKVASPVAAVVIPALLAQLVSPELMVKLCDFATLICSNPTAAAGVVAGVVGVLTHTLGSGAEKVVDGRK